MIQVIKLFLLFFLFSETAAAHPGIGIVKDSKGNIYYTDLQQVWKITNGQKTIIVPDVHTHELYIDNHDNLYGEGGYYDDNSKKFFHYLWVYRGNGQIDTVIGMKQAYVDHDFSLARDKRGNEYYVKRYTASPDTNHIYRRTPDGIETVFASGSFKNVTWLHPQENGSLLYTLNNSIYKVDSSGKTHLVRNNVGNSKPSFKFSENNITIWGVWQDRAENIYVAVFSDQAVKRINRDGTMNEVYKSTGNWTPLHGVFDNENKLWVIETSDKNDVRVTMVGSTPVTVTKSKSAIVWVILIPCIIVAVIFLSVQLVRHRKKEKMLS